MSINDTIQDLRQTLTDAEAQHGPDHLEVAHAAHRLAISRRHDGRVGADEAEALAMRAINIYEHTPELYQPYLAGPLILLASIRDRQGRKSEAEAMLRRAIELQQDFGEDVPGCEENIESLAFLLLDQRRFVEAAEFLNRAMRVMERHSGPDCRLIKGYFHPLSRAYVGIRRFDEAIELLRRTLAPQPRDSLTALDERCRTVEKIAAIHILAGRPDAANETFEEARQLRIMKERKVAELVGHLEKYDPQNELMENAINKADSLAERNDHAEAVPLVEEVIRHRAARTDLPAGFQFKLHTKLAGWKIKLKQFDEAETLLDQARAWLEPKGVPLDELERLLAEQQESGHPLKPMPYHYVDPLGGIWSEYGHLYGLTRRLDDAVRAFETAVAIWKVTRAKESGYVSNALAELGFMHSKRGELDRAAARVEEALAWEVRLNPESSNVANLHSSLAVVRERQGRDAEAARLHLSGAQMLIRNQGAGNVWAMMELNTAGQMFLRMSDWDNAKLCFQQTLGIVRESILDDPQPLVGVLINLSSVAFRQRRFEEAVPPLQEALAVCEREPDKLQAEHRVVFRSLMDSLVMLDRNEEAETIGLRWLAHLDKIPPGEETELPAALANLAQTYHSLNRHDQALRLIERAIPIVERQHGPNVLSLANYFHIQARILKSLGHHAAAKAATTRAREIEARGNRPD
ncbi:MAG: tetratricopeptide repeat protein [Planctomycetota bacterium]